MNFLPSFLPWRELKRLRDDLRPLCEKPDRPDKSDDIEDRCDRCAYWIVGLVERTGESVLDFLHDNNWPLKPGDEERASAEIEQDREGNTKRALRMFKAWTRDACDDGAEIQRLENRITSAIKSACIRYVKELPDFARLQVGRASKPTSVRRSVTAEVARERLRKYVRYHRGAGLRETAKAVARSTGWVCQQQSWKEHAKRRRRGAEPKAPKAVAQSGEVLDSLIAEQQEDFEPSPLSGSKKRLHSPRRV